MAWLVRWGHVYSSMLGLAALLFFSITGFTLNHADWFFADQESRSTVQGSLPLAWVNPDRDPLDKLTIVEALRQAGIHRGRMTDFQIEENQLMVAFKGPGFSADAFINRETGSYEIQVNRLGLVAILNDLHKGRDSGPEWSLLIDVSALGLTFLSLTGLGLLFYIKKRLMPGLAIGLLGGAALWLVWRFWCP